METSHLNGSNARDESEFKARCLAVLDPVAASGEGVLILKRGRPVARLVPTADTAEVHPQRTLRGTVTFHRDVLEPVLPADDWEAEKGKVP